MLKWISFSGETHHPFCTKCGVSLEGFMQDGDVDRLCPHIAMLYSDLLGELLYCHPVLDTQILENGGYGFMEASQWDMWLVTTELSDEEADVFDVSNPHPVETIMRRFSTGDWLCVSVKSRGFGCGPISETLHVVYDLSLESH